MIRVEHTLTKDNLNALLIKHDRSNIAFVLLYDPKRILKEQHPC